MKRTLPFCLAIAATLVALSSPASAADRKLPVRVLDSYVLRQLPEIKIVIRNRETLIKMGLTDLMDIDFSKEMGLFISLGADKVTGIEVKAVRQTDERIVVEVKEYGFEEMLAITKPVFPYQFVVVPSSELPVEGFVEDIAPCKGLCAVSTLVSVGKDLSFRDFRDRAKARGYEARKVAEPNPMIKRLEWMQSITWDVGPTSDPKGIRCRFRSVKSGGGAQCFLEYLRDSYAPPPKEMMRRMSWKQREAIECPASEEKIADGIVAAYQIPRHLAEKAARQVAFGYNHVASEDEGLTDIPAIRKSEIQVDKFRNYINSDGTKFVSSGGNFIDEVDEVGKHGTIRWMKPYVKAENTVDGLGKVLLAYNELGLFQMRIEEVQTTSVDELRKEMKKLARRVGVRIDDDAMDAIQFSFCVIHSSSG